MIVQTIEISMTKGRAADILAHVGEEGREIEFIPDVELSADDHTAEIDTVKPDGTFTMTTCSIGADGHIIAPITPQAVAVKGLCHYIIKIYNDDIVIYSACGSLWVDDHLITDDMIESIAEVNGYRFPQDFATLEDIPSADDFIDDNAVVTDKTWSSDKINNELSNLISEYTTSDKVVGKWIDNKPVYEISYIRNTAMTSGNTIISLLTDCETVVSLTVILHHVIGTQSVWTILPVDDDNATAYVYGDNIYINISASYANNRANAGCIIIARYTKTTD